MTKAIVNLKVNVPTDFDSAWQLAMDILQVLANDERMGYQVIALEVKDNHHENMVAQILPDGVAEYDPDLGFYSDGDIKENEHLRAAVLGWTAPNEEFPS